MPITAATATITAAEARIHGRERVDGPWPRAALRTPVPELTLIAAPPGPHVTLSGKGQAMCAASGHSYDVGSRESFHLRRSQTDRDESAMRCYDWKRKIEWSHTMCFWVPSHTDNDDDFYGSNWLDSTLPTRRGVGCWKRSP